MCIKKYVLFCILFIFVLVSCSLDKSVSKSSKIFLITVSSDYYEKTSSQLPECINDTIAIADQFKMMAGDDNNLEVLSFYSQFGNQYIQQGFDKSLFQKKGIKVPSAPTINGNVPPRVGWACTKGAFQRTVKIGTNTVELKLRIGKPNLTTADQWSKEVNWGADLQLYNPDGEPGTNNDISMRYAGDYWIYRCFSYGTNNEEYEPVRECKNGDPIKIHKGQLYPITFDAYFETDANRMIGTEISGIKDESFYSTTDEKGDRGDNLFYSYSPSFIIDVSDVHSEQFIFYKIDDSLLSNWRWKVKNDGYLDNCVDLQDKVKEFLNSKNISKNDVVIFYYSGHGNDGVINNIVGYNEQDGALLISNGIGGVNYIKATDVLTLFEDFDCYKVFITDSCYSGAFVDIAGSSLLPIQEYNSAWSKGEGGNKSYFQYYSGNDNVFTSLFSNLNRNSGIDNRLYVISGSTPYNTSFAGSAASGMFASCRYSVFTCSLLKYLGYDVVNMGKNSTVNHKTLTLYGMYTGALKNVPYIYKTSRSYMAQNPQTTQRVLDLILF